MRRLPFAIAILLAPLAACGGRARTTTTPVVVATAVTGAADTLDITSAEAGRELAVRLHGGGEVLVQGTTTADLTGEFELRLTTPLRLVVQHGDVHLTVEAPSRRALRLTQAAADGATGLTAQGWRLRLTRPRGVLHVEVSAAER